MHNGLGLGVVTCLRNDSLVPDTLGAEDLEDPQPGRAFFYLYRGSDGTDPGSGDYGQTSAGTTRTAQLGDCPQ